MASATCGCTTTARRSSTRRLPEKIAYAKAKGIAEVGVITNGSLLGPDVARAVVEAGLDAINISLDAAGRDTFESTRLGLKYDKVIANVEGLVRIRRELGRTRPKLILSFVRQDNSAEEQAFIDHWSAVADKIHITELHNWAGTLKRRGGRQLPLLSPVADLHRALGRPRQPLLRRFRRPRRPRRPHHASTIADVWNGDAYRRVRREQLESGGPSICRGCDLPAEGLAALGHEAAINQDQSWVEYLPKS